MKKLTTLSSISVKLDFAKNQRNRREEMLRMVDKNLRKCRIISEKKGSRNLRGVTRF
jgi:hypothetical protein